MPEPVVAYLGLGANLGDREANIRRALSRLGSTPGVRVLDVASLRETEPVGGPSQPLYLNGAARVETTLGPHALLAVCKAVEREIGRTESPVRDAPRPVDLDLLLFGDRVIDTPDLVVPHPRLLERGFVLDPLRELGVDVAGVPRLPERPVVELGAAAFAARCDAWRRGGASVGLVPTMGALHEGHASLLRRARQECDRVVATVFVNPLQFGRGEDLERYPRPFDHDVAICAREGVDLVFAPPVEEMYPPGFVTRVTVGPEAEGMEGDVRPGHFEGVATVVVRLWSLARPDRAYFGEKDAQQLAVVARAKADLGLPGDLVPCAIVREPDGLAMSSRNVYLSADDRRAATALHRALRAAQRAHDAGERRARVLRDVALAILSAEPRCATDYVELRDGVDLRPLADGEAVERARMLIAARVGTTRLIDNATIGGGEDA